jgi:hypothetical protein
MEIVGCRNLVRACKIAADRQPNLNRPIKSDERKVFEGNADLNKIRTAR